MKRNLFILSALCAAFILMSFYVENDNPKYQYMTVMTPVSVSKAQVFISKAGEPLAVIDYKKEDFDMSSELARIQAYEDEGWELFSVVNQNSVEMNLLFVLRRKR